MKEVENDSSSRIKQDIQDLLNRADSPLVQHVQPLRRRAQAIPELDDLAATLMELEQALGDEDTNKNVDELLNRLGETASPSRRLELSMADREPFPETRLDLLKDYLEELGGRVIRADDKHVTVQVPDETAETRVKSLYHWSERRDS